MPNLTRRTALMGALCSLAGCGAIASLNAAATPLNTYDLSPVSGSTSGSRSPRILLVAEPQAPAAIASDRIVIKPDSVSITYLPEARWTDELQAVAQNLLVRSISETGRVAYVGASGSGPVPDRVLLVRIDAFEVVVLPTGGFEARTDFNLTMINDRDQRVIASRRFSQSGLAEDDSPNAIVAAFQAILNELMPGIADWAVQNA